MPLLSLILRRKKNVSALLSPNFGISRNLCYIPREHLSKHHSASVYWYVEYLSSLFPAGVFDYVSAVLSDVLHSQRDPLPLCLALLQYDKELVASKVSDSAHPSVVQLHRYYSKWLPQQRREELVSCRKYMYSKKIHVL